MIPPAVASQPPLVPAKKEAGAQDSLMKNLSARPSSSALFQSQSQKETDEREVDVIELSD